MSEPVPNPTTDASDKPSDAVVPVSIKQIDWTTIINDTVGKSIDALERHSAKTGRYTAGLLGGIVVCLSGLAWFALCRGHIDTAEKIIIAMVSFLGGAAIFNSDSTRK